MRHVRLAIIGGALILLLALHPFRAATAGVVIPGPAADDALAPAKATGTLVLAGGCFWGMEEVFEHVKGVIDVTAGYSGGSAATAHYELVSTGTTGHAESVKITYDKSQISLGQLLEVFFSVAHDPTQVNEQWPDQGPQYRSVIFYGDARQQEIAKGYVAQLNASHVYRAPIATQVVALSTFYAAEAYHQDYADHHPNDRYIVAIDLPKLNAFRKAFPQLYVSKPKR
jgi:peptide-methionine (S)-S-oxide reductase